MTQMSVEQYNGNCISSKVLKNKWYFHLQECFWCVFTVDDLDDSMAISVIHFCPFFSCPLFISSSFPLHPSGKEKKAYMDQKYAECWAETNGFNQNMFLCFSNFIIKHAYCLFQHSESSPFYDYECLNDFWGWL